LQAASKIGDNDKCWQNSDRGIDEDLRKLRFKINMISLILMTAIGGFRKVRKKDGNCKLLAELGLMIGARRILDSVFIIQKQQTCNLHRVCSLFPMLIAKDRILKGLGFLTITG
jgi:hypothetical protein